MSGTADDAATPPKARRPLSAERKAEANTAAYETGFAKPPRPAQFKKGTSGNPSGRPKGSRALRTDVLEVLDLMVQVQLPQGVQTVTMQLAMVLSMAAKAAKGDTKAATVVLRLMELSTPERLKEAAEPTKLDPNEQALFDKLMSGMGLGDATPAEAADPPAKQSESDNGAQTPADPAADGWDIL